MDLKESARQWVLTALPYDRSDTDLVAYLSGLDAHGLLVVYHNWLSRLIASRPRKVHVSSTLAAKLSTSQHRSVVEQIIDDIKTGRSLNRYLSRGVRTAAQVPCTDAKFNRRRDLDLMLIEWEMHHLHLSTDVEADGFVSRTSDLLFAVFRQDAAYLVDIMPHGSWTKEHLLQVLKDELPGAGVVHEVRGIIGPARERTEEEYRKLREAGLTTMRMIGGQAVMTSGFFSGAGTSFQSTRAADHLISLLESFEQAWADHSEKLRQVYRQNGIELPAVPEFEFSIAEGQGQGVWEKTTRTFFPLR